MSGQAFLTITRPGREAFDVSLDYTVTYAGQRAGWGADWNNPYGEPPEGPEFDFTAYDEDGTEITLTPEEEAEAYEKLCEAIDW